MQPVPKSFEEIGAASRFTADDFKVIITMLNLCPVFRVKQAAHALDQTPEHIEVELVATTKRMDHLGLGIAFVLVPDIVGELDVFDDRAVLVFTFYRSKVHAQLESMYLYYCQLLNYNSCA